MDDELTTKMGNLDGEIAEALKPLTSRQRVFAEHYAAGNNATKAATLAGYSLRRARQTGSRLVTKGDYPAVVRAIELLRTRHALEHGLPLEWKRKVLASVAESASDVDGRGYVPSAAVRAVNEMNLMDGTHAPKQHHVTNMSVNVDLNYQIDVPREKPVVIEQDDVSVKKESVTAFVGQDTDNK